MDPEKTIQELIEEAKGILNEGNLPLYNGMISELDEYADVLNQEDSILKQRKIDLEQKMRETENGFKKQIADLTSSMRKEKVEAQKVIMEVKKELLEKGSLIKTLKELKKSFALSGSNIKATQITK